MITENEELGDVQAAIIALSKAEAIKPTAVEAGFVGHVVVPRDWEVHEINEEDRLAHPLRSRGTIQVYSSDGFIAAVQSRTETPPLLYADEGTKALVAILNDDTPDTPGWRDYRVTLAVRQTPEWKHWVTSEGFKTQQEFAEAIEHGLDEIVEPAAAEMLAIAETFEAKINTNFKQGALLGSGARQLVYEEEIDASAGKGGSLVIPETIVLGVQPFIGGTKYRQEAKIKFKLRDGKLQIGYFLTRPHETERAAFLDTANAVAEALGSVQIEGQAPQTA